MVVFNETFSAGKPIYYPSTWETGKDYHQIDMEFKLSTTYFLLSNLFEIIASSVWIFVLGLIVLSGKELFRLYFLKDTDRQRKDNQKYLKGEFLGSISIFALVASVVTYIIIVDSEWTRFALLKGFITWAIVLGLKILYPRLKSFGLKIQTKWQKRNKKEHSDLSQQEMPIS